MDMDPHTRNEEQFRYLRENSSEELKRLNALIDEAEAEIAKKERQIKTAIKSGNNKLKFQLIKEKRLLFEKRNKARIDRRNLRDHIKSAREDRASSGANYIFQERRRLAALYPQR